MSLGEWLILLTVFFTSLWIGRRIQKQTAENAAQLKMASESLIQLTKLFGNRIEDLESIISRPDDPWSKRWQPSQYDDGSFDNNAESLLSTTNQIRNRLDEIAGDLDRFLEFKGIPDYRGLLKIRQQRSAEKKREEGNDPKDGENHST